MKKNYFVLQLLTVFPLLITACANTQEELVIELDEYTPTAYVGEEYDFTDVLYVEEGVDYKLEVYYQNYVTKQEFTLPVVNTFYFTPVELFDLTVIINASRGKQKAKRTRHVPVAVYPEEATRYNIEMCNFDSGEWRGTGSRAEFSYTETYGPNSKTSRKINFADSWDLPDTPDINSGATVNAGFILATTPGLGVESGINAKECILSFDVKFSEEFYNSNNLNRNLFTLKIEDDAWIPNSVILNLTDSIDDFDISKTDNGWLHVEQNLYESGELDGLGNETYVLTLGFFGIDDTTCNGAYAILDNIALTAIPDEEKGDREEPSRYNIEMCRFEPGAYRGTGSKAEISYTDIYGSKSTSSRKVSFSKSEGLPDVAEPENNATVNASFNLANTWSIGVDNGIDANNCTLSFDVKLSEEFFNSSHPYKHMFSLKIEDETWVPQFTWISFVNNAEDFKYENTDNGWISFSYNLAYATELAALGNDTYVITFGFFGITNETRDTAYVIFDNVSLTNN